jgi:hypothetical protein
VPWQPQSLTVVFQCLHFFQLVRDVLFNHAIFNSPGDHGFKQEDFFVNAGILQTTCQIICLEFSQDSWRNASTGIWFSLILGEYPILHRREKGIWESTICAGTRITVKFMFLFDEGNESVRDHNCLFVAHGEVLWWDL